MKTFTAPEGKLVTVLVDGVEVSYVPGQEYPDNAEFIVTSPVTVPPWMAALTEFASSTPLLVTITAAR